MSDSTNNQDHQRLDTYQDEVSMPDSIVENAIIAGRYILIKQLGRGGMGEVWLAKDKNFEQRRVAIKFLSLVGPLTVDQRQDLQSRFSSEAEIMGLLTGSYVVGVLDRGQLDDGRPFIVMNYLKGQSLAERLQEGPLPTKIVVKILEGVSNALLEAHALNIIHRDLKPANIFLEELASKRIQVKVLDFGIAKLLMDDNSSQLGPKTKTGVSIGTPPYMAPEQFSLVGVGPACDMYSLGIVAYECLTGKLPFVGDMLEIVRAHATGKQAPKIEAKSGVPPALIQLVESLMNKDPELRPLPDKVIQDLQDIPTGGSTLVVTEPTGEGKTLSLLLMFLLFTVVFGVAAYYISTIPTKPQEVVEMAPAFTDAQDESELAKQQEDEVRRREAAEKERQAKLEAAEKERQAKLEAAEKERQAKLEAAEKERQAKLEAERKEAAEKERQAKLEAERKEAAEKVRQAKLEAKRREAKKRKKSKYKGMVFIAGTTFDMGCVPGDKCEDDEKPRHKVKLDSYYIDKTEVTVKAYTDCVRENKCDVPSRYDKSDGYEKYCNYGRDGYGQHPINCVNWHQAKKYCEAYGKRLPTEAEWEYAARGNSNHIYPWGNQKPSTRLAIFDGKRKWQGTAEVGSVKVKMAHGLKDMAGNVWEWVQDCYDKNAYKSREGKIAINAHMNKCSSGRRVLRGGSFRSNARGLRSSVRFSIIPSGGYWNGGFRCLRQHIDP